MRRVMVDLDEAWRRVGGGFRMRSTGVRRLVSALSLTVLVGMLAGSFSGCGGERPRHLILVGVSGLRADHTSMSGYGRLTTPHLKRLSDEGLGLSGHFANAPWAKPAVASLFTGLHPTAHGCRVGGLGAAAAGGSGGDTGPDERLDERLTTLAERLRAAGYRTWAWEGSAALSPARNFDQGFDTYRFEPDPTDAVGVDRRGIDATVEALRGAEAPTFLYLHLVAPRFLAAPEQAETGEIPGSALQSRRLQPRGEARQAVLDAYDRSLTYVDSLLGELVEHLDREAPDALLVVTGTHGIELIEDDDLGDEIPETEEPGRSLGYHNLHVPAVIRGAGVPVAQVEGLTDLLDVYATVLDLAGVAVPEVARFARPLLVDGRPSGGKEEVFAELHAWGPSRRYVLIREGEGRDGAPLKAELAVARDGDKEVFLTWADALRPEGSALNPALSGAREVEVYRRIDYYRDIAFEHRAAAMREDGAGR